VSNIIMDLPTTMWKDMEWIYVTWAGTSVGPYKHGNKHLCP